MNGRGEYGLMRTEGVGVGAESREMKQTGFLTDLRILTEVPDGTSAIQARRVVHMCHCILVVSALLCYSLLPSSPVHFWPITPGLWPIRCALPAGMVLA